ncbi:MAG: hypothetical protein Tsb002_09740 [Wenzhouxiangellaceae bacterium]
MSDWTSPQSLAFIPNGKLVTFTALHQAALTQYVQIIDSNGNPIAFTTLDGQSARFPISGTGTTVGFFTNGAGKFTMQEGYKIQFKNSGSNVSLVSAANPNQFFINGTIFGGGTMFVTEDQGGTDYNDTSFVIQWYQYEG